MRKIILIMLGLCLMVSPCLAFSYDNEAIINPQTLIADKTVTVEFTMQFEYSESEILEHFIASSKLIDTDWTVEIYTYMNEPVATKHYTDRSIRVSSFDFTYKDTTTVKIYLVGKVSEVDMGKQINVFTVYTQKAKRNGNEMAQTYKTKDMYVFTQYELEHLYDEIEKQLVTINAKINIFTQNGIDTGLLQNSANTLAANVRSLKSQQNIDVETKNRLQQECEKLLADMKTYENKVVENNLQWAYQNLPDTQLFRDKYNAVLISWQNGAPNMEASIELVNTIKSNSNSGNSDGFNPLFIIVPLGILGVLFLLFKGKKGRGRISHSSGFREDKL